MKLTVRLYKENEVQVANNLTEEEANKIAIDLTLQKFNMLGIKTEGFDVAILREIESEV